jgi:methylenetetrahydrofolate reductase (NADPH)
MNAGIYLDSNIKNAVSTDFCVGVGGYPEKHIEAPNLEADIQNLKRKVDAGADYVITQMFFDNKKYFSFVEKCRTVGIKVPIIPGIKPISTRKQIELLPHAFALDLPVELMTELKKCKDDAAVYECGIDWCVGQCKELLAAGAPAIHFYTMGKAENIKRVIKAVF